MYRSKTNQDGNAEEYGVPHGCDPCPIKAVRDWIEAAGITDGPLFRGFHKSGKATKSRLTGHTINAIVKKHLGAGFTGHSLRRGLITDAARQGFTVLEIQQQSGHKSANMVADYAREATLFSSNLAGKMAARKRGS